MNILSKKIITKPQSTLISFLIYLFSFLIFSRYLISEQGYSSKTLCNSSFKTFLALDEYVAPGVSTLIRNSLSGKALLITRWALNHYCCTATK